MAEVMNGPDSFSKCVTIGSSDRFFEVFSKNLPLGVIFGYFAFLIDRNRCSMDWYYPFISG